ncbi:MAG: sigma-70 family RNA polymerase sigma factor [Gemmataceae bacterium]|nr:sigma-70 family RNA polymerase sigma factor [Gemmataceae bacterium]
MESATASRLSQISTAWTVFFAAHGQSSEEAKAARRQLLQQYSAPVHRYLRAACRDADVADDLYQEFALRLVRGDFHNAHPEKGRLRDFLKTALYHLVVDYQRKQQRRPAPLVADNVPAQEAWSAPSDEEYIAWWRAQLLANAWDLLAEWEQATGQPLYTVLRSRAQAPQATSQELAEQLAAVLNRPLSAGWVRKNLHDARARYTHLLIQSIRQTLQPTGDLDDELLRLGLLDYCRPYLRA